MIKKITTLVLLILNVSLHAQWVEQNSGVSAILNDAYCITENTVIVVGDGGTILKTIDGGENWIQKTSGSTNNLTKVQFVNPIIGYAVGASGMLLKTIDAGENWSPIDIGETTNLYGISIFNESLFYITGENGLIKKTINGGISFDTQVTPDSQSITDVQFLTDLIGYAQGERLLKTVDGGITWSFITDYYNSSFFFLNENIGFINDYGGGLYKTFDGGLTFSFLGSSGYHNGDYLFSLNENTIWKAQYATPLCGCASSCITKAEIVSGEYVDALNCHHSEFVEFAPIEAIYFANEVTGYAVGWNGAIYKNSTGNMLSLGKYETGKMAIYPNPSSGNFSISFPETVPHSFSISITDSMGKEIFKHNGGEIITNIDIADFARGLYFVTVTNTEGQQTQKLIVN